MANTADHAQNGFDVITSNTDGDWVGFLVVIEATVAATTSTGDNISSTVIPAGVYVGGPFTNITPSAGTVYATRRKQE